MSLDSLWRIQVIGTDEHRGSMSRVASCFPFAIDWNGFDTFLNRRMLACLHNSLDVFVEYWHRETFWNVDNCMFRR